MTRHRVVTTGLVALAVVLVATAGVWYVFLATPPITETELNATTPDPTVATAPPEFAMRIEVTSRSRDDGTIQANWSAGVMYDADARERLGWLHSTGPDGTLSITQYQRYSRNRTHNAIRYHTTDAEQFGYRVGSIREDMDAETETLHVDNASKTYTYYRAGRRSEFEIVPDQIPPLGFIYAIPFEHDDSITVDGDDVERYVPVTGWTEHSGSVTDDGPDWYIQNPIGEVYVSEESGHIVYANVSVTSKRTDVRAGRWLGDRGNRGHFTLVVREDVDEKALRPEWVEETPSSVASNP